MNIQGGGISFEISGTNDKLLRILEQSKSSMQNFSGEVKKGGKDVDGAFNSIMSAINKARADLDKTDVAWTKTYDNLVAKLNEVKAARQRAWSTGDNAEFGKQQQATQQLERQVSQWEKLGQTIRSAYSELDAEEAAIRRQYDEATKLNNAHVSIRTQLAKAKNTLMEMEQQGKRGTEEYQKQQAEVVRLAQAMKSANAQQKNLSNANRNFQAVIGGLTLMTSGYQAVTGAMGLFAGENENLQRIMTKVQSVMSITMALQTAYTQLNKNSAFQLVLVAKAKDMLTAANTRLAAALGISTVAAQALMATLTLGLSVAITAIIALIAKMSSESTKAKDAQEKFNKKVAEAAGEPLSAYASLQAEWLSLTGSMKEREKWVQDNASKFEDLGFRVRNAKEAEDLLVNNTKNFTAACMAKAKALAAQNLASEKYKEIIEKQAEIDAMPDKTVKYVQTAPGIQGTYEETENTSKKKAQKELAEMQKSADALIQQQLEFTKEEQAYLSKIGMQAGQVVAGSVEAAEKELNRLRDLYNKAGTETERNSLAKKIAKQEAEVDSLSYKSGKSGGSGKSSDTDKDPYEEMLNQRKALYAKYTKWVQSEDETVRAAASTQFDSLLKEGTSYLDFLTNKRDEIMAKQKKTSEDTHKLQLLNNEIAETTKQTVLADFNKQLQADLDSCKTIGEMLDVIERRREQLSGDNSDIDNGKADILQTAQESTTKKAKEETAALLQEYAQYQNEKILFEESYARKKELLTKQSEQAATEAERQVALAALEGLENKRKEYEKRSASERYDELKTEYKNYEQQINDLRQKYQDERNEATKQGDYAMIAQINAKEQEAISKLAAQKLMASESWTQLFSDLSTLSSKTINKLMADINSQKVTLSAQFNPADLQAINTQLQKAKDELHNRNPFLALKDSLKELRAAMNADKLLDDSDPFIQSLNKKKKQYQDYTEELASSDETVANSAKERAKELLQEGGSYVDYLRKRIEALQNKKISIGISVDEEGELSKLEASLNKETGATKTFKEGLKDAFSSVGSSIDFVSGTFDSVVSGMKKMGVTMDEETEAVLGDLSSMMDGASQVANGIASGNPLGIIQGSVSFLSSAFDLFNSRDRKAEKSIKEHEKAVTRLGRAYNQLQHEVDRALGETVYQNQSAMIRNLRQQQNELSGAIEDEKSKKKTDWDRIEEWQEKQAELSREIDDIIDEITQSITQTDASSLAEELGDALVEAFSNGTSAAEAFDEVAGDVLRNAVLNALKLQFLEKPLQTAIKRLQQDMGFDEEGNGSFDGLTKEEQDRFRNSVKEAGAQFQEAFKLYEDLFNELNENDPSTLSGAIKGASQESIDLLAGQTNAVRMNQVTSLELLREQLQRLSNIDANVGVIAGRLLTLINKISTPSDDGLRGQGITE